MSPNQVCTLGPELLPWARQYTDDLSEAHFLVYQVVASLLRRSAIDDEPVAVDDARGVMSVVARQNGIAGRITP
jgi:hypothetical protein